ncbi:MAG: [FeFe] hydrogenase H-cluster radical SAM maturase HydE [Spirochaetes bacterium GWD1_27_9]|nr:MAG: [FeFe] hydrogenase H-cluster radical SAM maturase HydE [Spirochaetes bacterium GWB1_27_13]OHD27417.1 MAG: [FeFe] hydrogenase H-cluster radical SAM maturase HydE [Spirochaetes bacterium GWC1_27_15]OHD31367.1 MAG: [FeFe] hydrogenase H-cluster radical SAM maturase HydE [Spirochaetes bacterium GWD1_27_9]
MSKNLLKILDNAVEEKKLNDEQLLYLLELENADELNILYKTANFLRHKHLGNSCCVHGILEFSNYCKRNCFYCGISNHNASIERYRMTKEEILKNAEKAVNELSFQTLVLQCGEDSGFDIDSLVDLIKEIKSRLQVLIFISVGEIGLKELELLYEAGARGLLMRFETSNSSLYQKLHPNYSLQNRISHIEKAYKLGYLVITGSLIGLPDQTDLDLLNDIKLAKSLNAEMYSFGPFIPHPFTPLKNFNSPKVTKILKVLALTRILDPQNAKILVTSAFETIEPEARKLGLMAGANSIMLNATPKEYKKHYQIYPGRVYNDIDIKEQIDGTISMLRSLGRSPTDL